MPNRLCISIISILIILFSSSSITTQVAEHIIDRITFRDTILEMVENINMFQICRVLVKLKPIDDSDFIG